MSFGTIFGNSFGTSSDACKTEPGTANKQIIPFKEFDGEHYRYETITLQREFRDFSLEEHRLKDYEQIRAGLLADTSTKVRTIGLSKNDLSAGGGKLNLLRGIGIEICVGTSTSSDEHIETNASNTWCLPISLISYYSPFLQTACSWSFQECRKERIELPEDDPAVFSLFVEWMYYGSYNVSSSVSGSNIDAKCWVLGDKLLCSEFTNYAMSRLYKQHTDTPFSQAVTCDDVQYACENTPSTSKLRRFYVDFVMEYFASPVKLHGTIGDWDAFLQRHSDIRVLLLEKFRQNSPSWSHIRDVREYLELVQPHSNRPPKLDEEVAPLAITENNETVRSIFGSKGRQDQIDSVFGLRDTPRANSPPILGTERNGQEESLAAVSPEETHAKSKRKDKKSKLKNRKKGVPIEPSTDALRPGQEFPALESELAQKPTVDQETEGVHDESAGIEEIT